MKLYRIYYSYFELATGDRGDHRAQIEAPNRAAALQSLHASMPGHIIRIDEVEIRGAA